MASQAFTPAKCEIARGTLDLSADNIDVVLVMTLSGCQSASESSVASMDDFGTLDEFDGSGYSRKNLTSQQVNQDDPNNRAEMDAADITWSSLGAGTRNALGVLLFKNDGTSNDGASVPIAFLEFSSSQAPNGADFTVQWNAEGILQL